MRIVRFAVAFLIIVLTPLSSGLYANPFSGGEPRNRIASPPVYSPGSGKILVLQFEFRDKVATLINDIRGGAGIRFVLLLALVSFLYGILHAAGPGHRKTVVFSLFLSRSAKWYEPLAAGFLSAGIHGGTSLVLVGGIYALQKTVLTVSQSDSLYACAEGGTFVLLALLSIIMIVLTLREFREEDRIKEAERRNMYAVLVVSSLVPCPGAMMILLLSLYANALPEGVLGIVCMSIGMGVVISFAGFAAFAGRSGIIAVFEKKRTLMLNVSRALTVISFLIIILFSSLMAWPFVRSIISMI